MKILITCENYYPVGGGIQQFIRGLAEYHKDNEHKPVIYTQNYPKKGLNGKEKVQGIDVYYSKHMTGSMSNPFGVLKNKVGVFREFLQDNEFDLVFANNHNSLAWIQASKKADIPVVYGCHGVGLIDPFSSRFLKPNDEIQWGFPTFKESLKQWRLETKHGSTWKQLIWMLLFYLPGAPRSIGKYNITRNYWRYKKSMDILDSADARYGNSSLTANLFNNQENTYGFPLPINATNPNFSHHYKPIRSDSLLEKYGLEHKNYMLCTSRIHLIKGQEYLIKALKDTRKDVKVVLAGNSSLFTGGKYEFNDYERKLRRIISENELEDRVVFTGLLEFEQLRKLYTSALVTVVPSIWLETFGYVTVESMTCETPVIVTENCGSAECIDDKKDGFLIKRKSSKPIAEVVNKNSKESLIGIGKKARKKVVNNYDWKNSGKSFIRIFEKLIN